MNSRWRGPSITSFPSKPKDQFTGLSIRHFTVFKCRLVLIVIIFGFIAASISGRFHLIFVVLLQRSVQLPSFLSPLTGTPKLVPKMANDAGKPLDPLVVLPSELSFQIFSCLSVGSVAACRKVCKSWDKFLDTHAEALWQYFTSRDHQPEVCTEPDARHVDWEEICKVSEKAV